MIDPERSSASLPAHRRYMALNRQRHVLLPKVMLLGSLVGLLAVAFRLALMQGEQLRQMLLEVAHASDSRWSFGVYAALTTLGIIIAACLVRMLAPAAAGSGIPHVKAVLLGYRQFQAFRLVWVKFLSGVIGIASGLALGREGPTVQMAGAIGSGLGDHWRCDAEQRKLLIAAGSGAGLTAAFNAPLSGMTFVLEELGGQQMASLQFFATAIACLFADMVCRLFLGQLPVFHVPMSGAPALVLLPGFVVTGLVSGLAGVVFNRSLLTLQGFVAASRLRRLAVWLLCGGLLALAGWHSSQLTGGGQGLLECVLNGNNGLGYSALAALLLARFGLTLISYATGSAGGIFAPILLLGALTGLLVGQFQQLWFPALPVDPTSFAVVGMAGWFTAVVRAPLTGMVLMIEMTGNYELILPLLACSFTAMLVADALRNLPIYEALLERELGQ